MKDDQGQDELLNSHELGELARNVGGVAVQDGGVAGADLSGVVQNFLISTRNEDKRSSKELENVPMTWALNEAASLAGSFLESEQTLPRRMSLMETFFTLKPTLSPKKSATEKSNRKGW